MGFLKCIYTGKQGPVYFKLTYALLKSSYKLTMVAYAHKYVTNTWKVETGELGVQGKCGYMRPCHTHPQRLSETKCGNSTHWRGGARVLRIWHQPDHIMSSKLGLHFKTPSQKNWRAAFQASSLKLEPYAQSKGVSLRTKHHSAAAQRAFYWESACSRGSRLFLTPKRLRNRVKIAKVHLPSLSVQGKR